MVLDFVIQNSTIYRLGKCYKKYAAILTQQNYILSQYLAECYIVNY